MGELLALVGFALVITVSPGPNNVLLWASGAAFGFVRTIPHILGTAVGVGLLGLAVAAGLGVVVTAFPALALAMRIVGSVYLLYLAWRIAHSGALRQSTSARPLRLVEAAAFQLPNPKVWIFALSAITTFRPPELPIAAGSLLVVATMMLLAIPTAAIWAAGGGVLSPFFADDTRRRKASLVLGGLVAVTVISVWI
ncbi:MAG: LysE family translocator [Candidatus Limnocylindrales bacterium]